MIILCTVDITTREVTIPSDQRIASYDHKVDVIRFQVETIPGFSLDTSSIKIAAQGPNKARHDYAVDPSTVQIEEETGYITFDWPIPAGVTEMPIGTFKYGDKGQLIFAVCAEIIDGSTVSKAWHSDDGIITVVAHLEPESGGGEDPEEEATNAQKIGQLQTDVAVIRTEVGALANGSPAPVATAAEMTDESAVYLYTGSETGYTAGNWYYYDGSAWTSGGTYGGAVTDSTLTDPALPANSKAAGDAIGALDTRVTALESDTSGGLTADIKSALLACFANVAWANENGQTYYDALDAALNPPANLSSITAVYTQSGTVYDTASLDDLKPDLVVTAHWSDNTTSTITTYTLSGTLAVGTSTITVSYGGKTTTFTVTVTEYVEPPLYSWDFRNSNLTDSIGGLVAATNATQDADGIKFSAADKYLVLNPSGTMSLKNKKVEIDIASMSNGGSYHSRLFSVTNNSSYKTNADANSFMWKSSNDGWYVYSDSWSTLFLAKADYPGSYFSGKTLVLTFDSSGYPTVSVDGTDLLTYDKAMARTGYLVIGGSYSDQLYRLAPTISAVRIYEVA